MLLILLFAVSSLHFTSVSNSSEKLLKFNFLQVCREPLSVTVEACPPMRKKSDAPCSGSAVSFPEHTFPYKWHKSKQLARFLSYSGT